MSKICGGISFSNNSFYDSNLITVPQAKKHEVGFGIDFYYVEDGRYDSKTRTNVIEAKKVCDMVFEHLKKSKESLGVVAFSNVQAELIADLVDKRIKKNPALAELLTKNEDEPFFVKNLESVQGDERDRIIFSICYGYNEENKSKKQDILPKGDGILPEIVPNPAESGYVS